MIRMVKLLRTPVEIKEQNEETKSVTSFPIQHINRASSFPRTPYTHRLKDSVVYSISPNLG